jgi:hypothetical protein
MAFAIKAEVCHPRAKTLAFTAQKTMYGGKQIARGDTVFVFASENEGGRGLIARGIVTSAKAIAKKRDKCGAGSASPCGHAVLYRRDGGISLGGPADNCAGRWA